MKISIIVPCLNEAGNIAPCVESLLAQSYPARDFEIIVADGGSTDGSLDILARLAGRHPAVRLVHSPEKWTASVRNTALEAAAYDYVALIDADCQAPPDWLSRLAATFLWARRKDPRVVAVGGPNVPPRRAPAFVEAIGIALDSYPGSFGSVQGRRFTRLRYVGSLATLNALYDRAAMAEAGYFDASLRHEAEDADLNHRLGRKGYRFIFNPDVVVRHEMRPTPGSWLKNMFRYGKGRARLLKRYPEMWAVSFVLPLVFGGAMASVLLGPVVPLFYLPLLYFPAIFGYAFFRCRLAGKTWLGLHVGAVYLIQHFGYAAGEIYGLCSPGVY